MAQSRKPAKASKKPQKKSIFSGYVPPIKSKKNIGNNKKTVRIKTAARPKSARRLPKDTSDLTLVIQESSKKQLVGFLDFIREQGVVGLAIGFVMGAQAKVLIDSFTNSFITPLLGLLLPGSGSLASRGFSVTVFGKTAFFQWGNFVWTLINFLIVAFVIYFVFKMLKLDKLDKPKK